MEVCKGFFGLDGYWFLSVKVEGSLIVRFICWVEMKVGFSDLMVLSGRVVV